MCYMKDTNKEQKKITLPFFSVDYVFKVIAKVISDFQRCLQRCNKLYSFILLELFKDKTFQNWSANIVYLRLGNYETR